MSIAVHNEDGERVFLGEVAGVVTDNRDPLKIGRVRVRVDGLVEPESPWAFPSGGAGGGAANFGSHNPPPIGATVVVSFLGGNPDVPIWKHAWRGSSEGMTALGDGVSADDAANKIKTFETVRYLITLDERDGSEALQVKDKISGNLITLKPGQIILGDDGEGNNPLQSGLVLASGIDTFTGATYGALGSASKIVTARKT